MIIKLNGAMFLNEDEYFFDDLVVEFEEDEDFDFECDCDIEDYIEDCDDCCFCDCNCEEDYDDEETLDELIEDYADTVYEFCDDEDFDMEKMLANFLIEALENIHK